MEFKKEAVCDRHISHHYHLPPLPLSILCVNSVYIIHLLIHVAIADLGLLSSEASIASLASSILKELVSHLADYKTLLTDKDKPSDDEGQESMEASAIKSVCLIFENALATYSGTPDEHILGVITVLFLNLGMLCC